LIFKGEILTLLYCDPEDVLAELGALALLFTIMEFRFSFSFLTLF